MNDIQVDETAKTKQKDCPALEIWLSMSFTYPAFAQNATPQLQVFPST